MPVLANDVVQIEIRAKADGQDILNVLHYRYVNPLTVPVGGLPLQPFADTMGFVWNRDILPLLHQSYVVTNITAKALRGVIANPAPPPAKIIEVADVYLSITLAGFAGALAGDPLPTYSAVAGRKSTDRPGRSYRGGIRWSVIPKANTVFNSLAAGYFAAWVAEMTPLNFLEPFPMGDVGMNTAEMCVFSRTRTLEEAIGFTDMRSKTAKVVQIVINEFISSQVSRKRSIFSPT